MRLQRRPKARLSALPTISPSLAPKCPRPRKRSKPELASRPAASLISRRRVDGIKRGPLFRRPPKCRVMLNLEYRLAGLTLNPRLWKHTHRQTLLGRRVGPGSGAILTGMVVAIVGVLPRQ